MNEQLPAPNFDATRYERPNDKWICGHVADGKPCRIGPSPNGKCRATFECAPLLEKKEGEPKGRYKCTRPKSAGGPCENGPLPDGKCSHAIPPCAPVRSIRAKRGLVTRWVIVATVGVLLIAFFGPWRTKVVSPPNVSAPHTGENFAKLTQTHFGVKDNCAACHVAARTSAANWAGIALRADPNPTQFATLLESAHPQMTALDVSCAKCHAAHNFHQPNVAWDYSCSTCHREHASSGAIPPPENRHCIACHGDAAIMQASLEKGKTLLPHVFDYRRPHGLTPFPSPRPSRGYTEVFQSFADHPEFQIHTQKLRETNTLRFNHARHFADDIPLVGGKKLDCAACHKPDAEGAFHVKMTYEANCAACHALQFDERNPDLTLPHGDAAATRAFLRSLPTQYADLGNRKGVTNKRELTEFVAQQMEQLRQQHGTGEDLERQVFFNADKWGPVARVGGLDEKGRAKFAGCAYCHEVKPVENATPAVIKPVIPDRWLQRGRFDHAKHTQVSCATCHDVMKSKDTTDILLPTKVACATCHSPQGGVRHTCATCHSYHNVTATK